MNRGIAFLMLRMEKTDSKCIDKRGLLGRTHSNPLYSIFYIQLL